MGADGERLAFDDVQILKLESAAIRGHTAKLTVVEPDDRGRGLAPEDLRERIAARIDRVPRLRQRVAMPRFGRPRWEEDPDFDLARHVTGGPTEESLDEEGLRARIGKLMSQRLDHERPLWRLDLLPVRGGRTAIVGRVHHCMADGVSSMKLLAGILWDSGSDAPGEGHRTAAPTPGPPGRGAAGGGRRARGPLATIAQLPATLRRELRRGADSPLDRHIGFSREVAWTGFPLAELKRIEHAVGGGATVNDVVLAAVSGALREWLEQTGARQEALKAQVPVSLHAREEKPGQIGNRDSFLFVDLPLGEPDPIERLRLISAETQERKHGHDAETLYSFFHSLSHFRPLYREVTRLTSGPREFALSVSNVPGPREPVTVMGRRLSRFCSFAEPADRHALRVAVVSLGGEVAFGFCSDPEAVPSLELISDSVADSLRTLDREA